MQCNDEDSWEAFYREYGLFYPTGIAVYASVLGTLFMTPYEITKNRRAVGLPLLYRHRLLIYGGQLLG